MAQSKKHSIYEANANAIIGIIISWLFTLNVLPLFGVMVNYSQATWITICFFCLSNTRAYIIRRFFNRMNGLADGSP